MGSPNIKQKEGSLMFWNVYNSNGNLIDCVWFTKDCSEEYVKDSLINHDGYDISIRVERE